MGTEELSYYKILNVSASASSTEIKKAFRQKAQKIHPDKPDGDVVTFRKIKEAYDVLSDSVLRAEYDAKRISIELNLDNFRIVDTDSDDFTSTNRCYICGGTGYNTYTKVTAEKITETRKPCICELNLMEQ